MTEPLAVTVEPFVPRALSVHSRASHCSQTNTMWASLPVPCLAAISRTVLKEEIFPWESPGHPQRGASLKGANSFSICFCDPWCNHEPALLSNLILVQVCSLQVQTLGLKMPLAEPPGAASTFGLLRVTLLLYGAHRGFMRGCRNAQPEWCHSKGKVYTENSQPSHQNSHQTSAPHIHGAVWPQNNCDSLCYQHPNLGQGKKYRAAEISHTPSPPDQCR